MSDVRFTQAAGAYRDALRVAEDIISHSAGKASASEGEGASATHGSSFMDLVSGALQSAANTGYQSEKISTMALMGKADIADVVTAVSNAETALNAVVAVRDRVINAYQDIIKMPI